jgi:hypothetical protein
MQMEQLDKNKHDIIPFYTFCMRMRKLRFVVWVHRLCEHGTSDCRTVRRISPAVDAKYLKENILVKLKFSKGLTQFN